MPEKKTTRVLACILLTLTCTCTISQAQRDLAGKLFLTNPRTNPIPDERTRFPITFRIPFRTIDGTSNNISSRQALIYGAADIALFREIPPQYGPSDPLNAMGGVNRPGARKISNVMCDEPVTHFNERGLSTFVYVWGQFIDHDMSSTPTGTTESVPILLPNDEVIFTEPIPFTRSEVRPGTGITTPRAQSNMTTAWLDASMVYGSDSSRAKWLRTFKSGKLKTSAGNLLPWNTVTGEFSASIDPSAPEMANDGGKTIKTFVAGDDRASEHPGIASLHTLFVREHNRICDELIAHGVRGDELLYQTARKEVGALIQIITYQEFLPALGVRLDAYSGYKNFVRPDIMSTFATAGYRIGHTMVADDIALKSNDCVDVGPGALDLVEAFWNPSLLVTYQTDPFLKGFATHKQYETDTRINSVLRNFLFGNPADTTRFGIDLASLNIQRGRDHGLPDYNTVRRFYTGRAAQSFSDISSDRSVADSLKKLYGNINNVDLWIGILAEDHLPGASVGLTMHQILKAQFQHLRDGDFYFYLNDPFLPSIIRNQLMKTKLSDVLKRNTMITSYQDNVFFVAPCPGENGEDRVADTLMVRTEKLVRGAPRLFPNPATSSVRIDFGNGGAYGTIKIYDAESKLVKAHSFSGKVSSLDLNISDLKPGLYFINISNEKGTKTLKLLKLGN
ncbi:MAG: hypothetical protein C5B52_19010 [Bacteroidetes bacterium]|nr:MAG: hypothetical protein C5B52_19010 [Bacteroidota bacterium]